MYYFDNGHSGGNGQDCFFSRNTYVRLTIFGGKWLRTQTNIHNDYFKKNIGTWYIRHRYYSKTTAW